MLKSFKLVILVILVAVSSFGAAAQTKTDQFKDVLLDGRPAKLNVKTGEVVWVGDKSTTTNTTINSSSESQKTTPISTAKKKAERLNSNQPETPLLNDNSPSKISEENLKNYHVVAQGETLYAISKQYNTSLTALKKANHLETTLVSVGQRLRVANFDDQNIEHTIHVWIVSKGDTLYSIARKNNITVASIKSLNGLKSDLIKIGQKLQLK